MLYLWLKFIIIAGLIIISGTYLSKFGDIIAEKTGLGQALIGGILLALATSLPELVTSITSSLVAVPDIAIGNVFGSNTFNLMILAIADLLHGQGPLMLKVKYSHILSGLLGILLSGIVAFSIMIYHFTSFNFTISSIGLESIIIVFTYLFGVKLIFRYDKKNPLDKDEMEKELYGHIKLKKALIGFSLSAVVIIFSGIQLTLTGDEISTVTGIDKTFIGSILIAAATSLPELVATIAAIRINAYNMAIGNVFGSNIFNMIIVFFADLFYTKAPVLSAVSVLHIITALIGLIMSTIALIGLFYRSKRTVFSIGWDTLFISIVYFLSVYLLFHLGINI
ncbi:MAG: sodium:calcium antiporter [Firmicutes bacterium]|nr:sodium:calcium antiporter [Bacillota bacterium]